ncbi:uncharacterized protein DS421_9g262030 [Arachis hypogaea]|nr:uncharacterized protein DS421_9g262030 [Arachis hypogaea]
MIARLKKEERQLMAKNNVVLAIAMLIVGAIIICSTITKFDDETTSKEFWITTSYNVVSNLDGCIRKCKADIKRKTIKRTVR